MNQTLPVFVILLLVVIGTLGAHVEAQKGHSESSAASSGGGTPGKKILAPPTSTKKPAVNGFPPKVYGTSGGSSGSRIRAAANAAGTKPEQPGQKVAPSHHKPGAAPAATEKPKTVKPAASRSAPALVPTKKPAGDAVKKLPEPVTKQQQATESAKKSTDTAQKARAH